MAIDAQHIRFGKDAALTGYLARPARAAAPLPGVVVIQQAWGLDVHIEDVTRRLAVAGYVALAPDLYARGGERPAPLSRLRMAELEGFANELPPGKLMDAAAREAALAERPGDVQARLRESLGALAVALTDVGRNLPPVLSAAAHLRASPSLAGGCGVVTVGFCMGGGLSALAACHDPELRGAVIFYGMAPPEHLIDAIRCPILGFYGADDPRIVSGLPAFTEAMRARGKSLETHVYPGVGHAFFSDERPSYDARATRLSFARLLGFLADVTSAGASAPAGAC
jgi:carboxymethylenebutenolidase